MTHESHACTAAQVAAILLVGVFVSHTVAAIIIMPLVATIGVQVCATTHRPFSRRRFYPRNNPPALEPLQV